MAIVVLDNHREGQRFMDIFVIIGWILSTGIGNVTGYVIGIRKANSEAKLTDAQIDKLQSEITLSWLKELQARIKELEEDNSLKDAHIEQLEAIIRTKRLPNPE